MGFVVSVGSQMEVSERELDACAWSLCRGVEPGDGSWESSRIDGD